MIIRAVTPIHMRFGTPNLDVTRASAIPTVSADPTIGTAVYALWLFRKTGEGAQITADT